MTNAALQVARTGLDAQNTKMRVIANIARYHRKSPPKAKHLDYEVLSPRARRIVDVGAGILRIADGKLIEFHEFTNTFDTVEQALGRELQL